MLRRVQGNMDIECTPRKCRVTLGNKCNDASIGIPFYEMEKAAISEIMWIIIKTYSQK